MTEITCDIFVCVVGVWRRDFLDLYCEKGMSNLYGIFPKLLTWVIIDEVGLDLPCGVCVSGATSENYLRTLISL